MNEMTLKLRSVGLIIFAAFVFSLVAPVQCLAQPPSATGSPAAKEATSEGPPNDLIKAMFTAVWHHDITSSQIGTPVKLKDAARTFQVPEETPMFPVHAQDASGWRHATYFYKDSFGQWHCTLDLFPIE
jgi:hypothetical protein